MIAASRQTLPSAPAALDSCSCYICVTTCASIENGSIFLGKWTELGLWPPNLFLLVVLEEEWCTSFALMPEMNSERKKRFCAEFSLLSFIFRTRRLIMQRIHILFIGFSFLSASSLSVFRWICKFTVLLTFISHELKGFSPSTALCSWRYLINTNMNWKHTEWSYKEKH